MKLTITKALCFVFVFLSVSKIGICDFFTRIPVEIGINIAKSKIRNAIYNSLNSSSECAQDLSELVEDTYKLKLWALKMLDANPKLPSGLLSGNAFPWGHYDQCVSIKHKNNLGRIIRGKYCYIVTIAQNYTLFKREMTRTDSIYQFFVNINLPEIDIRNPFQVMKYFKMFLTLCIPSSCSSRDLMDIFEDLDESLRLGTKTLVYDFFCDYNGNNRDNYPVDVYIYSFFKIIAAIILASTLYDIIWKKSLKGDESWLIIFSLRRHCIDLFTFNNNSQSNIDCLDGIRAISRFWIILLHTFVLSTISLNMNELQTVIEAFSDAKYSLIYAAVPVVDTFFIISGLLISYSYFTKNTSKIDLKSFYIKRYLRYTMPMVPVMLFIISIYKFTGDGPIWPAFCSATSNFCYYYWYMTLLHVINIAPNLCMPEVWHVSCDFQLYLIAPLIITNLKKRPKLTILGTIIAIFAAMIYTHVLVNTLKLSTATFPLDAYGYFTNIYASPIYRIIPWVIGINLGYILYKLKSRSLEIPLSVNFILTASAIITIGVISHIQILLVKNFGRNNNIVALYLNSSRLAWCLAVAWIILCSTNSTSCLINRILSHWIFQFISRLSYSMFLTSLPVTSVFVMQRRSGEYFSFGRMLHMYFGDVIVTLMCSLVLYLCFEAPSIVIIKKITIAMKPGVELKANRNSHHTHIE